MKKDPTVNCWKIADRPPPIRRPEDAYETFKAYMEPNSKEQFMVVMLDARHRIMSAPYTVTMGTLNASLVHPREVFGPALSHRAAAIIVAHNHPSGDTSPSGDDLDLTGRLDKVSELMGIALLDHLILSVGDIHGEHEDYLSIREYGWPSE